MASRTCLAIQGSFAQYSVGYWPTDMRLGISKRTGFNDCPVVYIPSPVVALIFLPGESWITAPGSMIALTAGKGLSENCSNVRGCRLRDPVLFIIPLVRISRLPCYCGAISDLRTSIQSSLVWITPLKTSPSQVIPGKRIYSGVQLRHRRKSSHMLTTTNDMLASSSSSSSTD